MPVTIRCTGRAGARSIRPIGTTTLIEQIDRLSRAWNAEQTAIKSGGLAATRQARLELRAAILALQETAEELGHDAR